MHNCVKEPHGFFFTYICRALMSLVHPADPEILWNRKGTVRSLLSNCPSIIFFFLLYWEEYESRAKPLRQGKVIKAAHIVTYCFFLFPILSLYVFVFVMYCFSLFRLYMFLYFSHFIFFSYFLFRIYIPFIFCYPWFPILFFISFWSGPLSLLSNRCSY